MAEKWPQKCPGRGPHRESKGQWDRVLFLWLHGEVARLSYGLCKFTLRSALQRTALCPSPPQKPALERMRRASLGTD